MPIAAHQKKTRDVIIEGRSLKLTNLGKVLYPSGFTKAGVIDYYTRVAKWMLPHLENRMLTLKRYPDGTTGDFFYEKRCPSYKPEWLKSPAIEHTRGKAAISYCQVGNTAGIVWVANLASLEFHTLLSKEKDVKCPTMLAIDLDPGPGISITNCARYALILKDLFKQLELESFPKTSGGKGLHVYVPLNTAVTFDKTKAFAHALALHMEKKFPNDITSLMKRDLRLGKIMVDWSQNDEHKTTVCVYSLRAREEPTVSTPLTWQEVLKISKRKDLSGFDFNAQNVPQRLEKMGDLFEPVLKLKPKLPSLAL